MVMARTLMSIPPQQPSDNYNASTQKGIDIPLVTVSQLKLMSGLNSVDEYKLHV